MSYNCDGSKFATGGDDKEVNFWDDETNQLICKSETFYTKKNTHSNKVFCAKFLPGDENVCLTGGWDMNLILHDVR